MEVTLQTKREAPECHAQKRWSENPGALSLSTGLLGSTCHHGRVGLHPRGDREGLCVCFADKGQTRMSGLKKNNWKVSIGGESTGPTLPRAYAAVSAPRPAASSPVTGADCPHVTGALSTCVLSPGLGRAGSSQQLGNWFSVCTVRGERPGVREPRPAGIHAASTRLTHGRGHGNSTLSALHPF